MTPHAEPLLAALGDVLERLAFAEALPAEAALDWSDPSLIWAAVELRGPVHGTLWMGASAGLLERLAADAWGGPSNVPDPARAFAEELANTAAGLFLVASAPAEEPHLGLPVSGRGACSPPFETLALEVEGETFGAGFTP